MPQAGYQCRPERSEGPGEGVFTLDEISESVPPALVEGPSPKAAYPFALSLSKGRFPEQASGGLPASSILESGESLFRQLRLQSKDPACQYQTGPEAATADLRTPSPLALGR